MTALIPVQEQKKKLLTFEEICPVWSRHIFTPDCQAFFDMHLCAIGKPHLCIVGEAWKWTDNYYAKYTTANPDSCKCCTEISALFPCAVQRDAKQVLIDHFVNHWNEAHVVQKEKAG